MQTRTGTDASRLWTLDTEITFLNHGSFGACPRDVLEEQSRIRARLEREPVHFFNHQLEPLLDAAREELGRFVGADPGDLAFVHNASTGVSTVVRSLALAPGDELLTTSHVYNACRNALAFAAGRAGARVVEAPVPFPLGSADDVADAVLRHLTPRTRLVLIDHVTSPTGVVFPVERLVQLLAERGIDTLVDGAHGPGMLPLSLDALGAAYYTGNCHKWMCTPKGAGFLHVRKDRQDRIRPLTLSHGANSPRKDRSRFRLEFDFMGTDDPSAWLCIPAALRFFETHFEGGLPSVAAHNRRLAAEARKALCDTLHTPPACPDELLGSLAAVLLPETPAKPPAPGEMDPIQVKLFERFRIEVPVWGFPPKRWVRVSAQAYNHRAQYEALAEALAALIAEERGA